MSQPWNGVGTLFSLSLAESSFGSEAARARSMRATSANIASKTTTAVVDDLSAYLNGPTEKVLIDQELMGSVSGNLAYKGNMLGLLLKAVFGGLSEGGGGGPVYAHTFTSGTLASHTGEVTRGNSGTSEEMRGLYGSKMVVELPARGTGKVTVDFLGQQSNARAAPSPSVPAASTNTVYVLGHQCGGLVLGGTTYETNKITITVDNKLDGLKEHGSIYIGEATRSSRLEVYIDVELNQRVNGLKTIALAGGASTWSVTCTDGTNILAFSGSSAFIENHDDAISSTKPIPEKIRLRCLAIDGTAAAITAVLTNTDNTYEDS